MSNNIEDKVWVDLVSTKYQAIYAGIFNSKIRSKSDNVNLLTSVVTSASVGGWAIWEQIPEVWAVIIAAAQILNIAKPYIKVLRDYELYHELQLYYEERHFELDFLWLKISLGELTKEEMKSEYKSIYEKYHNLSKKFLKTRIERKKSISDKAELEWNQNLAKYGISNEQQT